MHRELHQNDTTLSRVRSSTWIMVSLHVRLGRKVDLQLSIDYVYTLRKHSLLCVVYQLGMAREWRQHESMREGPVGIGAWLTWLTAHVAHGSRLPPDPRTRTDPLRCAAAPLSWIFDTHPPAPCRVVCPASTLVRGPLGLLHGALRARAPCRRRHVCVLPAARACSHQKGDDKPITNHHST